MKLIYVIFFIIIFFGCSENHMKSASSEWKNNLTIYEVNIRQYTKEGTISAFRKHLPRLKNMGVGILWFMPIHPIGKENRKGNLGSYYSVKDYYGVNSEFGTLDEFKLLVNEIHDMGMYVILDWVANHTAWDNEIVYKHPKWYTKDDKDNFQPPIGTDWHDVIDLDYSNDSLRQYMADAMIYWVKEIDVDGFRCDVAGMVPKEFWENVIKNLNSIKPVFMLAEWDNPELLKIGFDADYNWGFYHLLKDIAAGVKPVSKIQNYFQNDPKSYPWNALRMNFLDNHDENSWGRVMIEHFDSRVYPLATMIFTLPGIPMIYSGQEARLNKKLKFFEKDNIPWGGYPDKDFYKALIEIRKEHAAFWCDNFSVYFLNELPLGIVGYKRKTKNEEYLVFINLSDIRKKLNHDFSRGEIIFKDLNSDTMSLAPYGYMIYKNIKA